MMMAQVRPTRRHRKTCRVFLPRAFFLAWRTPNLITEAGLTESLRRTPNLITQAGGVHPGPISLGPKKLSQAVADLIIKFMADPTG